MMGTNVFMDGFARDFDSAQDFFSFLAERKSNSRWLTAPSRELKFRPVERGTAMGDLFMELYEARGEGALMRDTMENTRLLMTVNDREYPVRSCAIKTILERARISGHALSKVSVEVFSRILNDCIQVASGRSLIKIADDKVSAVHGGDDKDYAVLEMVKLVQLVTGFLNREFPGSHFFGGHFSHALVMATWVLDGQTSQLLDAYRKELDLHGLGSQMTIRPALRFMSSDVGMSGANLYPILLAGPANRILPLGYPIKTEHKHGVDYAYFSKQLELLYAKFRQALEHQVKLMEVELRYPANALMGVLKQIKAPKKASFELQDEFLASHGDSPCTAYELFLYVSEIIFYAQCEGAGGARIAQLEEITARALHVSWTDFDHPGEFRW